MTLQCLEFMHEVLVVTRLEELLDALNLRRSKLSDEQFQQLVSLVKSYCDVLALTDIELIFVLSM